MPSDLIVPFILLAGTLVAIAYGRSWLAQTADLKLSLFRPYRGDPWPIGVQEDDDFHFKWTRAAGGRPETRADDDGGTGGAADHASVAVMTSLGSFEEVVCGSVSAERVGRIS